MARRASTWALRRWFRHIVRTLQARNKAHSTNRVRSTTIDHPRSTNLPLRDCLLQTVPSPSPCNLRTIPDTTHRPGVPIVLRFRVASVFKETERRPGIRKRTCSTHQLLRTGPAHHHPTHRASHSGSSGGNGARHGLCTSSCFSVSAAL